MDLNSRLKTLPKNFFERFLKIKWLKENWFFVGSTILTLILLLSLWRNGYFEPLSKPDLQELPPEGNTPKVPDPEEIKPHGELSKTKTEDFRWTDYLSFVILGLTVAYGLYHGGCWVYDFFFDPHPPTPPTINPTTPNPFSDESFHVMGTIQPELIPHSFLQSRIGDENLANIMTFYHECDLPEIRGILVKLIENKKFDTVSEAHLLQSYFSLAELTMPQKTLINLMISCHKANGPTLYRWIEFNAV